MRRRVFAELFELKPGKLYNVAKLSTVFDFNQPQTTPLIECPQKNLFPDTVLMIVSEIKRMNSLYEAKFYLEVLVEERVWTFVHWNGFDPSIEKFIEYLHSVLTPLEQAGY